MKEVVVVIGPGSIGQAIARRVSLGKLVLLAGLASARGSSSRRWRRTNSPARAGRATGA